MLHHPVQRGAPGNATRRWQAKRSERGARFRAPIILVAWPPASGTSQFLFYTDALAGSVGSGYSQKCIYAGGGIPFRESSPSPFSTWGGKGRGRAFLLSVGKS